MMNREIEVASVAPLRRAESAEEPPALGTLALVEDLCARLEEENVRYCHWKSTDALDRSASGENDLDLLVGRADAGRFTEILLALGFKSASAPAARTFPGVVFYYGLDRTSGKLVNVHAHYRLVLGHDTTKNYHLPIEDAYLASSTSGPLFRIPSPEFELVVFVLRLVLKHASWDAVVGLQGSLSAIERRELHYLRERADRGQVQEILRRHLPFIDDDLFGRCLRALEADAPLPRRLRAGRRLRDALAPHARRPPAADTARRSWRRASWQVRRRVAPRSTRKRLANGGAVVAIVGGDGAGKSTAADGLQAWLSRDFVALRAHMGKPRLSLASLVVRTGLRLRRSLRRFFRREPAEAASSNGGGTDTLTIGTILRFVLLARDRYRTYVRARRMASNGGIVVCDRYPVPQIKLMDGPKLASLTKGYNPVLRSLAGLERRYYARILPPEILIVLRVDPDIAVRRKVEEDPSSVRPRSQEVWEADWNRTRACVVDANAPPQQVLAELKSIVWSRL